MVNLFLKKLMPEGFKKKAPKNWGSFFINDRTYLTIFIFLVAVKLLVVILTK